MKCDEITELLGALADGEAGGAPAQAHVASCPNCAARLSALKGLSAVVRSGAPYHRAPADLRAKIGRSLRGTPAPAPSRARALPGLVGAFAGFACAFVLFHQTEPSVLPALDETVAAHTRAMVSDRLVEVVSSDHHTVKPWLSKHVDFSPPVPQLADAGFPLTGARVETIGGRTVAVLVYARRQHVIDVFVAPEAGPDAPASALPDQRGFHSLAWRASSFAFRAVSDLNAQELADFARLMASKP